MNPITLRFKAINLDDWADVFRLMRERDRRSQRDISDVADYVLKDDFWKTRIQSPGALRAKWDQITAKMNKQRGDFKL